MTEQMPTSNSETLSLQPWLKYKHIVVRDLAWLLLSPELFIENLQEFPAFQIAEESLACPIEEWLAELDASSSKALSINGQKIERQKFRRLGIYCESLMEFFFAKAPWREGCAPQSVVRNFRVDGKNKTLGECDFLLPFANGKTLHIEMAVKFYLQHPYAERAWNAWLGPNAIDRLDIKLNRMIDHQLTLPNRPDTKEIFDEFLSHNEIEKNIESQYFLKGALFSHAQSESSNFRGPEHSNEHLLRGEWVRISEFLDYEHKQMGECILCDKMEWLSGPEHMENTLGLDEVTDKMRDIYSRAYENKLNPPGLMLMLFDSDANQKRLMIVPDQWPETNSPLRNM